MNGKRAEQFEAPGKDSFLDVVANVVAILIILVIVVGSQATNAVVQHELAKHRSATAPSSEVAAAKATTQAVEDAIHDLEHQLKRQQFEIDYRRSERNQVQLLVTVAEQRLTEYRNQLTTGEQVKYDLQQQLVASRGELAKLSDNQSALSRPPPTVLQHLPTPMAKTVFGTELHFRLLGGRLAYVPWDEMLEKLKADAPNHVDKLRDAPRAEMSLPVINGFGARYVLRRNDVQLQTRVGPALQARIVLEKIYFVDAEQNMGVPLAQALQPGSEFRGRLAGHKPQQTTVTVWTYPDSFDEFRTLKAELFKLGYLTAARPLPAGHPIGGSPDGSRSSAE